MAPMRRGTRLAPSTAAVAVLAVVFVGCGGETVGTDASVVTTTTAPADATSGSVTEYDVVPSVDWMEVDDQGLWVRSEPGLVERIDPETGTVAAEIQVGGEPCNAMGVGDGSVWTCAGTDVVRLDPVTLRVTATYPVNKTYSAGEVPVIGGSAWVLVGDGSSLVPIDTATDTVGAPIALPARGTELSGGPTDVWVISGLDDVVMRIDAATGQVTAIVDVPSGPVDAAIDDGEVWVVCSAETVRIDAATGEVAETFPVGGGSTGGVALTDDTVWVRSEAAFVERIDRATGAIVADEHVAEYRSIADRLTSSGDITTGFGAVWTAAYDDAKLFRLEP